MRRKYKQKIWKQLIILLVIFLGITFAILIMQTEKKKCTEFEYCWNVTVIVEQLRNNTIDPDFEKFFNRDPVRIPPNETNIIVSPADGEIIAIKNNIQNYTIIIRMSLLDVHVQRVPLSGKVVSVEKSGIKFNSPSVADYLRDNVQTTTVISTEIGNITVKQITGNLVKKIETFVESGDQVKTGDKLGKILLGSTVVLTLPKEEAKIIINLRAKVYAGTTIIATIQ